MTQFRKRWRPPWSGLEPTGPSLSGTHAQADGLLALPDLVKWLRPRLKGKISGRITHRRIELSISCEERHHWRNSRGQVKMVEFFNPEKALREILELGEYF